MGEEAKRYAVVTGANKGIGYGICKKLASRGIVVVLTARNEERGLEALERLKEFGLSHHLVVFHQLAVDDPASVATLTVFIKTQFGKLDILIGELFLFSASFKETSPTISKRRNKVGGESGIFTFVDHNPNQT